MNCPLPQNLDAERAVLGAILLDNEALEPAIQILQPADFSRDAHRRIFARMVKLSEQKRAIDLVTVHEELERAGELEAGGGSAYLGSLVDGVPRVSNIGHYARIVKEKALLRQIAADAARVCHLALRRDADPVAVAQVLAQATTRHSAIARTSQGMIELVPAEAFLALRPEGEQGWLVEGLLPERSQTTWQGRPKVGKSHTLLQLAFDLACGMPVFGQFRVPRPRRVLYVELEEPEGETKRRFAAMLRANGGDGPDSEMLSFFPRTELHRCKLLAHELFGARLPDFCQAVRDSGAELVVLVALRRVLVGDVSESDVAERFNDALDLFAHETGTAMVLAHHNRKAPAETTEARGFGSTMLAARADAVFDLSRTSEGMRQVAAEARYDTPERFFLQKQQVGDGELIRVCSPPADKKTPKLEALRRRVAEGESIRQAARAEGVPFSTAQRWSANWGPTH